MSGHGEKLSRKKDQAVAALLSESTIDAAAKVVGINERTLRNWLKLPQFQSAYRAARRQVVEAAVGRLQQASSEAVATLERNLTCDQASVEVRAAVAILDQSIKAVEILDMEERLAELEQQVSS